MGRHERCEDARGVSLLVWRTRPSVNERTQRSAPVPCSRSARVRACAAGENAPRSNAAESWTANLRPNELRGRQDKSAGALYYCAAHSSASPFDPFEMRPIGRAALSENAEPMKTAAQRRAHLRPRHSSNGRKSNAPLTVQLQASVHLCVALSLAANAAPKSVTKCKTNCQCCCCRCCQSSFGQFAGRADDAPPQLSAR